MDRWLCAVVEWHIQWQGGPFPHELAAGLLNDAVGRMAAGLCVTGWTPFRRFTAMGVTAP